MPGILDTAATQNNLDPALLDTIARIESGGNPNARTGSYKGLFQLSDSEFNKYGGGDIYSAVDNANAAAAKIAAEAQTFRNQYGREPTPTDIYMVHQQGQAGYGAHMANPDQPAWQNMLSTGEGRQKGAAWAKQAIWGNVPDQFKAQFGNVNNLTSQQFVDLWRNKVEGTGAPMPTGASYEAAPFGGAMPQNAPLSAASLAARTTPAGVPLTAPPAAAESPQADLSSIMPQPMQPFQFAKLQPRPIYNPITQFLTGRA